MDKELLRTAIIATGIIIMVIMVVSSYLKSRQEDDDEYEEYEDEFDDENEDKGEDDNFDDPETVKKPSLAQTLRSAYSQTVQKVQQHQKRTPVLDDDEEEIVSPPEKNTESHRAPVPPAILQFSVITKPGDDDFNVADIFHVLESLELEYGSMKIFERVDENRFVHFGVANMVEPGTFPDENIEDYYSPGVVFFMQVDGLENPKATFDNYIKTALIFSNEMDGTVLDHRRQPLTDQMVTAIRAAL
jgi:cell division protein ZipA